MSQQASKPTLRERLEGLRPSVITGGAATMPLMVLFGLNAVDELDREAFSILIPNIRDHFNLSIQGVVTLGAVAGIVVLFLEIPLSHLADRYNRIKISVAGAAAWGGFTVMTGLAPNVAALGVARTGSGLGKAVNGSTHNSLIADWYPPEVRPGVFAVHRAANSVGQLIGPITAGVIAFFLGWRAPFLIFAIPTFLILIYALRLQDPIRGGQERRAIGASDEVVNTEEKPASMAEAFRIVWAVRSIRRIFMAVPFLAVALAGLGPFIQLFYEQEFGLNELQRGLIGTISEPFQILGYIIGIPIATRMMRRDPGLLVKFVAVVSALSAGSLLLLVAARNLPLAVASAAALALVRSTLAPGLAAAFSLAIPPRVRSLGFSVGNLFILPGLFVAPVIGGFADTWGLRPAMLLLIPLILLGSLIIGTASQFLGTDIQKVRNTSMAIAEARAARLRGEPKILMVKGLDVSYGQTQVLFGVDFEVDEGETIALLGTNGAGKSTLLKAISGLVDTHGGAVVFDGADLTQTAPNEIVSSGIVQAPGGKGVFPGLSVAENLKTAGWLYRGKSKDLDERIERVLEFFPVLRERWDQVAGDLSGGEQQMLTLGMAFIGRPKLLMIDELSLGLAPVVVEQLLPMIEEIREQGTTILLVEQSVNIALTVAQTAYFMEKGEIRFKGPTAELLDRPDILRSVFLEGAASVQTPNGNGSGKRSAVGRTSDGKRPRGRRPVLQVRGLTKSYGGVHAVDDVNFDLLDGQILGVIGPNGAGKTTVFDLISGFVPLDSGKVVLHGREIAHLGPDIRARMGLGRSFQDAKLFPALTVRETIANSLEGKVVVRDPVAAALSLPAVAASESDIARRTDELIEIMNLGAFASKFVSELSTGSRRIVDLACIIGHDPSVLLFDEPSSGIAQRETEALGPLLLRVREATSAALLVIEHDMPLITSISDSLLALDLGRVVTQGSPRDVVNDPRVVASYLGSTQEVIRRSGTQRSKARSSVGTRARRSGGRKR